MKRILFIINIALLSFSSLSAQKPSGRAYPNGIYIFCGKEIPRDFHYRIEKKEPAGEWMKMAELRGPKNAAELKANLFNLPAYFRANLPVPFEMSDYLWQRQSLSPYTDSLYAHASDPKILSAVGCGWFDDGLATEGDYQYRISKVSSMGATVLGEVKQHFPENIYKGTLSAVRFEPSPETSTVTIYYGLSDSIYTYNVKLYRSRLQENNYKEVANEVAYTSLNEKIVAVIRDESAPKGMAYDYVAVPCDFIGNPGTPSAALSVYNMSKMSDIGILSNFSAVAEKDKRGVTLKWKMESDFYIQGYEIFRSKDYDGRYNRIATLPSDVTSFFDDINIDPGEAYFYYMTVNNGYGVNVPSARTPVILEGNKENIFPPQDLEASLHDNVVQLLFRNMERDTRGYQIFRGEGYTGQLSHIATISVSASENNPDYSSMVVFCDTLELSGTPKTYSYAVADVNSSYKVSPLSERVTIQFSGGLLPAPMINEIQFRDNGIFIVWNDVSKQNAYINGYNVFRTTVDNSGAEEEYKLVATLPHIENFYVDTMIVPGKHYRYMLETLGINEEKSGQSLPAGVTVPAQRLLPPGQVSAIAGSDRIVLRWDNPIDPNNKNIRIYRAELNVKAILLKELPADQNNFEDRTAKKGIQYFYYVVTVNNRGEESEADEAVSAKIR